MSAAADTDGGLESPADKQVDCPAGCGERMDENQLPTHLREQCPVVIDYRRREGLAEFSDAGPQGTRLPKQVDMMQYGVDAIQHSQPQYLSERDSTDTEQTQIDLSQFGGGQ